MASSETGTTVLQLGSVVAAAAGNPALAFTLAVASLFTSRASAKRRLKEARVVELSKLGTSGAPFPICYGRCQVQGIPVYAAINDDIPIVHHTVPTTTGGGTTIPATPGLKETWGSLVREGNKARQKALLMQDIISIGEIEAIKSVLVNGKSLGLAPSGSGIQQFKSNVARVEWWDYETASATATAFTAKTAIDSRTGNGSEERDANSKFLDKTAVTALHYLSTSAKEEVVYSGNNYPEREYFVDGAKVFDIFSGGGGSVSGAKNYSNNTARVLFDYLNNPLVGPRKDGAITGNINFDLESFGIANSIAFREVVGNASTIRGSTISDEFLKASVTPEIFEMMTPAQRLAAKWAIALGNQYFFNGVNYGTNNNIFLNLTDTGFLRTPVALKRYEFNGTISSEETWEDGIALILQTVPGAELFFRERDDEIVLKFPDSITPEATQSVRTFTNDDIVDEHVNVDFPDGQTDLVNQVTGRFNNNAKFGEEDTVTFPKDDSRWFQQLSAKDQGKFHQEFTVAGIDTENHMKSWIATTILMSHRNVYTWEVPKWEDEALDVYPGSVVTLNVTGKKPINRHVRLNLVDEDEERNVVLLSGRHFVRTDYEYWIDDKELIPNLNAFSTGAPQALTAISAAAVELDVTVTLTNGNPDVLDRGFEIQNKTVAATEWDQWDIITTLDNPVHTKPTEQGTYIFRARKFDVYYRTGPWITMPDSAALTVVLLPGLISGTGPPANLTGDNGQYYFNRTDGTLWLKTAGVWGQLFLPGYSTLRFGTGVPMSSLGDQGDFYFNQDTRRLWRKDVGGWLPLASRDSLPATAGSPVSLFKNMRSRQTDLAEVNDTKRWLVSPLATATLQSFKNVTQLALSWERDDNVALTRRARIEFLQEMEADGTNLITFIWFDSTGLWTHFVDFRVTNRVRIERTTGQYVLFDVVYFEGNEDDWTANQAIPTTRLDCWFTDVQNTPQSYETFFYQRATTKPAKPTTAGSGSYDPRALLWVAPTGWLTDASLTSGTNTLYRVPVKIRTRLIRTVFLLESDDYGDVEQVPIEAGGTDIDNTDFNY